jgi:hypothetical protein
MRKAGFESTYWGGTRWWKVVVYRASIEPMSRSGQRSG